MASMLQDMHRFMQDQMARMGSRDSELKGFQLCPHTPSRPAVLGIADAAGFAPSPEEASQPRAAPSTEEASRPRPAKAPPKSLEAVLDAVASHIEASRTERKRQRDEETEETAEEPAAKKPAASKKPQKGKARPAPSVKEDGAPAALKRKGCPEQSHSKKPAAKAAPSPAPNRLSKGPCMPPLHDGSPITHNGCKIYTASKAKKFRVVPFPGKSFYDRAFPWKEDPKKAWRDALIFANSPCLPGGKRP
jgi:hypothetical protein